MRQADIAYGKDSPPEGYIPREIQMCDILICVIGGRFGTESQEKPGYSITQQELSTAMENQVQVYIFIEQGVHSEYQTYLINKETTDIKYQFVDNSRIMSLSSQFTSSQATIPLRLSKR